MARSLLSRAVLAMLTLSACSLGSDASDGSSPIVSIDAPLDNAVVGSQVPIQVTAIDDFGVDKVQILIDNVELVVLFTPPFHTVWNTTTLVNNSPHTILVRAYDVAKNFGSRQINVTVQKGTQ